MYIYIWAVESWIPEAELGKVANQARSRTWRRCTFDAYVCSRSAPAESRDFFGNGTGARYVAVTVDNDQKKTPGAEQATAPLHKRVPEALTSFRSRSSFISSPVWTPQVYGPTS